MKKNSTKILLSTTLICLSLSTLNANQNKTITVKVPKVPKVHARVPSVDVVTVGGSHSEVNSVAVKELNTTGMVGHEKRVPPNYYKKESKEISKDIQAGEVNNSRLSAYLQTALISKKELIEKLQKADFKILSEYKVDKKRQAGFYSFYK